MSYNTTVKNSKFFLKELKRLSKKFPSLKQDVADLKQMLLSQPRTGDDLGKGAYKIRLAITSKGKGKSGGARVISHVETEIIGVVENNNVTLLAIYDKSEIESFSKEQLDWLIKNMEFE
jgi:mRNA-degrading endonuclease RelE of RelBE toxin-antitoxin system